MPTAREVSLGFFRKICGQPDPQLVCWLERLVVSMRRDYLDDAADVEKFVAYACVLYLRARECMRLPLTRLNIVACIQIAMDMLDDHDRSVGYFDDFVAEPRTLPRCVNSVFVDGLQMNAVVRDLGV